MSCSGSRSPGPISSPSTAAPPAPPGSCRRNTSRRWATTASRRCRSVLRQFADVLGKRRNDRRRVLARKLDQHRKAAVALNQCGDVRIIPSGKKVAFPMAGHGTILGLGGPLADRDHIEDVSLPPPGIVAFGGAHLTSGAQVRRQLLVQHAARLNEEATIDRFVGYLHVLVGRELPLQPARDLLRRPLQRELLRHTPS